MSKNTQVEHNTAETLARKSKAAKTKETISFLSTAVPLLGVLGTGFVWLAANYFVGTVDIKPDTPYQEISVKVFDQKGTEKEFHTPHFLLQPGRYHIAVAVDNKGAHQIDTEIKLGQTASINVVDRNPEAAAAPPTDESGSRKHWWQFWKKSSDGKGNAESDSASDGKGNVKSDSASDGKGNVRSDSSSDGKGNVRSDSLSDGKGNVRSDSASDGKGYVGSDIASDGKGYVGSGIASDGKGKVGSDSLSNASTNGAMSSSSSEIK